MSDKREELKACPFCGGESHISRYVRDKDYWHVTCPQGGCVMFGYSSCGYHTETKAIAAWNTRPENELVEALTKICELSEQETFNSITEDPCRIDDLLENLWDISNTALATHKKGTQ